MEVRVWGCFILNFGKIPRLKLVAKNHEIYWVGTAGCIKQLHFGIGPFGVV